MFRLANYTSLGVLHRGPIHAVVRGRRLDDDLPVAVKLLAAEYPDPRDLTRLRDEYELTMRAASPSVVRPYDLIPERNGLALVMEDIGGESLHTMLGGAPMDVGAFLDLAIRVTRALGVLHEQQVIHKRLDPSHILVNERTGEVRLIGLAIASLLSCEESLFARPDRIEGTLAYVSPEQTGRTHRPMDWRTDLYSLGATFYEMLTGHPPFMMTDPMELVHAHIALAPVPPHEIDASIPPMLSRIVGKLLAKTADERYQSARGVAVDLERCRHDWGERRTVTPFEPGTDDVSERLQTPHALYGRQDEVAALERTFARVLDGATEFVVVRGYAGIGKSTLVNEVPAAVAAARGYFVAGKCDQLQRNLPFGPMIAAMRDLVRQLLTESDALLERWRDRLAEALGPNAQVIIDVIPELELVIGSQAPVPTLAPTPSRNRFNLTFRRFIRVFASPEHPLVIFLDDLQWSDAASLELVQVLLTDLDTHSLLLIGAYRDGDVGASHPLHALLETLATEGTPYAALDLGPLALPAITALVCDTVGCETDRGAELADVILEKTGGNPFFINEFLKTLRDEECLRFDRAAGAWTWELPRIRALHTTDNVVDLMAAKLDRLPDATRAAVQRAACIGGEFDLATLALTAEVTAEEAAAQLWTALEAGLVRPIGTDYRVLLAVGPRALGSLAPRDADMIRFRFLHDRVQQAAYAQVRPDQRQRVHLRMGRLLLSDDDPDAEPSFEAIDHLNRARSLIDDPVECRRLARFNLRAAAKAKAATAFGSALAYAHAGIAVVDDGAWEEDRETCWRLYIEAAECAYLAGEYTRMEHLCLAAEARAATPLEVVEIKEVHIKAYMARNELRSAIETARDALLLLGVKLPKRPTKAHVVPPLLRAMWLVGRKTTDDLARLPEMTDPTQLAIMRILTTVAQPAYYAAPDLLPVLLLRMVAVTIRHGGSPLASYAWMAYAHILNLVFGDVRAALRYGEFSRQLLERYGAIDQVARVEFMFNTFVRHWTAPWRDTLQPLVNAYRMGLQTGDLEYGATAIHLYCYHILSVGMELTTVEAEMARYNAAIVEMKQVRSENNARLRHQVVLNLLGRSEVPWRLVGDEFDEDSALPTLRETQDETALSQFHLYRAVLSYLFGQQDEALTHIEAATVHAEGLNGLVLQPLFHFYRALILLDGGGRGFRHRRTIRRDRARLARWAEFEPVNHRHRVELVDAERAAVAGRDVDAMRLYDQAIASARRGGYLGDEALALERAARFHAAAGRERIARGYVLDARHAYSRWQAGAKVAWLDATYEGLLGGRAEARPPGERRRDDVGGGDGAVVADTTATLEIATVMKASQALTREMVLPRLLDRLLRLAMENAGAQKGTLVLQTGDELRIEAHGAVDDEIGPVLESIPLEAGAGRPPAVPVGIVKYVARTREVVLLDDARQPNRFSRDPYLVEHAPRSVLCAPLVSRGKVSGIVYLENHATVGAFLPSRLEMLGLLSAQAAIAIENARLYADQVLLAEAQARFVPREFLRSLDRSSIVDVGLGDNIRKEMSVLFSDLRGFTSLVEKMSPQDHIGFINEYLSYMEPAIVEQGGFVDSYIGDAVMALFDVGADRAVQAGIAMSHALTRFNAERARRPSPPTRMGIGVNTGMLTLGTIGGPSRIKCSVIGDCVNLASRLELLTKSYDAKMLISSHTRERLADPGRYLMRWVDCVRVMGKVEPVTIYEVLDAEPEETRDAKLSTLGVLQEGFDLFRRAEFDTALRRFDECLASAPVDGVAKHYVERCRRYAAHGVPPDWDGVEILEHK